jgi:glycosyltransferase involved in cell wall biosynthesis
VLLEAMAAGKPIVAARAAAIPEAAPYATLVDPNNAEALAAGIASCAKNPSGIEEGLQWVERFDAPRVATQFLEAAKDSLSGLA